jgi:hypothetical protein
VLRCLVLLAVFCFAGCGSQTQDPARSSTSPSPDTAASSDSQPLEASAEAVNLDVVGRSAASAVRDFYDALSRQDYADAWAREAPPRRTTLGGYAAWKAGYRMTTAMTLASVTPAASDKSHARVQLALHSTDHDACGTAVHQRFAGTIDLRHRQGRWQITGSDIAKTAGRTVRTDNSVCPRPSTVRVNGTRTAATPSSPPATQPVDKTKACYPAVDIPAVDLPAVNLPAVDLPAVTLPATDISDHHIPAQHIAAQYIAAQHIAGQHISAQHVAGGCLAVPAVFAPTKTSVLEDGYDHLDARYSSKLSTSYWSRAGSATSYPDPTAAGFGQYNAAGFPKNQYVRPYMRRNGTMVSGYWRNSPTDGLPTCRIISC